MAVDDIAQTLFLEEGEKCVASSCTAEKIEHPKLRGWMDPLEDEPLSTRQIVNDPKTRDQRWSKGYDGKNKILKVAMCVIERSKRQNPRFQRIEMYKASKLMRKS